VTQDARFTSRGQRLFLRWATALYALALFTGTHLPPRVAEEWQDGLAVAPSDKLLHFSAYLGLAMLLAMALGTFRRLGLREYVAVGIVTAVLGALDEWTQLLPGVNRNAEIMDWVADATGAACGLAIMALVIARLERKPAVGTAAS
jgi:VanZ family protein